MKDNPIADILYHALRRIPDGVPHNERADRLAEALKERFVFLDVNYAISLQYVLDGRGDSMREHHLRHAGAILGQAIVEKPEVYRKTTTTINLEERTKIVVCILKPLHEEQTS